MPERNRDTLQRLREKSQRLKSEAARLLREAHELDGRIEAERRKKGPGRVTMPSVLWASPTAVVGSIGTILAGVDSSANWAAEGFKLELFTSSPLKATGIDGKPWTEEDRTYLRERMLQCDARIKSAVRAGRPQLSESALDGRWFFAENSLALGHVDAIAKDLEETLSAILA